MTPCWPRSGTPRPTTATTWCRPPPSSGPTRNGNGSGFCPGSGWPCPDLLTLGPYDPTARTGPAIWLRCVLAGKFPELAFPPDAVPILYLPGVSRPTLRATDECPPELRPLAELQYRGVFWSQHNGKDWTVSAFLQSEKGGLNLRLARDTATQDAIRRAIEKLMDVPVAELAAKSAVLPLDSDDFDAPQRERPSRRFVELARRSEGRPCSLAIGTGAVGGAPKPLHERLRIRPGERRRTTRRGVTGAPREARLEECMEAVRRFTRAATPGSWTCSARRSPGPRGATSWES